MHAMPKPRCWSFKIKPLLFLLLFLVGLQLLNACNNHFYTGIDDTQSSVHEGDSEVSINKSFSIHFTAPVKTETVTPQSFFLVQQGRASLSENILSTLPRRAICDPNLALEASVTCSSEVECTLIPETLLEKGHEYLLCLTREIEFIQPEIYGTFRDKSIHFTTSSALLESLTLSPSDTDLKIGDTQQFTVTGTYDNGLTALLNIGLVWSSSNNSIVNISESGLATALAEGQATIMATESLTQLQASSVVIVSAASGEASHYTLGGSISGLEGDTVVLQNNGGDDLTLTVNGDFTFDASVLDGESYAVSVLIQPAGKLCTILNGSGTISGANVTHVRITCSATSYTVGGSVSGLTGTLVLQNNNGDNLSLTQNGSFTFATPIADHLTYNVTILTQPAGQSCSILGGNGSLSSANVTSVSVSCSANTFTLGGVLSGASGLVVLQNNAGNNLSLSSNGSFTFSAAINDGASYSVTIFSKPSTQTCIVNNGSGTLNGANITNISVSCSTNTYSVGGSISGLSGTVVLQNNLGDNLSRAANGSFTFTTPITDGTGYSVTVFTQPTGQTCTPSNHSGTLNGTNITNVSITCSTNSYTIGGNLSGLSGTLVLQNNGSDNLSRSSDGSFTFATSVAHGGGYNVTVLTQPAGQTCTPSNNAGTVDGANITSVSVSCLTAPTISLNDINKNNGDAPFTLSPTSNSGGSFSYFSSNHSVATVSGNTVTIVGAGSTTITANQAASGMYTSGSTTATLTVGPDTCGLTDPCLNGGTCTNVFSGNYTCSCPTGYSGTNCELDGFNCDENSGTPCLNGGICTPTPAHGECTCPQCYMGPQCDQYDSSCA